MYLADLNLTSAIHIVHYASITPSSASGRWGSKVKRGEVLKFGVGHPFDFFKTDPASRTGAALPDHMSGGRVGKLGTVSYFANWKQRTVPKFR